ncbi:hypothetical protein [Neorhizobium vignae]|uniref:hypothetical protein n=1 Tax=Neorhizobium vignae TaxID=690585 RepID=UPI001267C2B4|nr:hypothetical protein [Neorhizobium vignae]
MASRTQEVATTGENNRSDNIQAPRPGDETEPGSKQSAEGICPKCGGSGEADGTTCSDCEGRGTITVIVGDA